MSFYSTFRNYHGIIKKKSNYKMQSEKQERGCTLLS